ncbi:MAG: hypothetical protein IKP64_08330 [Selenomonadaceae bacterium]|nr:hypothetical protein [Selenomonadaceae bacterium]MBR4383551.1 hypothetical protein [Selenomonadaceae bacterium]
MKFLDKLNLRRFAKVAAVAAVSGTLFFGGTATVSADSAGMQAFREAYLGQRADVRIVHQDLTLISPNFHLDVDSKAQVNAQGIFVMGGNLSWTYTNLKRNYSTNNEIPFFIQQDGNSEMKLYVKRLGRWSYMQLPGLPAGIATLWKSNDSSILRNNLDAVKDVEVIKDNADMRVMKVTLDGQKIAVALEKQAEASFAKITDKNSLAQQREIFTRWMTAIRANDITFNWTVNKPDWDTVTAAFDLTDIMHAYARYVLDESAAGKITLTDEERDLLDAMGYYAELKSYTTYISPKNEPALDMPADLVGAPENDNSLNDIFYEMTTVVQR